MACPRQAHQDCIPMVPELALVWLSSNASLQTQRANLDSWAQQQHVQLVTPSSSATTDYDPAVAEAIELKLEAVGTALALGQDTWQAIVEQAQAEILSHPELPQSAWLLAESYRLRAVGLARAGSAVEAAQAQAAAIALEGERAAVFGQSNEQLAPLQPRARVEIETVGPRSSDTLFVDGALSPRRLLVVSGSHHVRVVRGQRVVVSQWLEVTPTGGELQVPLQIAPCSDLDLHGTVTLGNSVRAQPDVRCTDWLVARQLQGQLQLARCHLSECQQLQPWPPPVTPVATAVAASESSGAWYVWPLAITGVALGTAAVLWQTGAFDGDESRDGPLTVKVDGPGTPQAALSF